MKHTIKIVKEFDLADLPFEDVLTKAFEAADAKEMAEHGRHLTYEILAARCGMKSSTVHRYFTDPNYNPPTHKLSRLNRGLGNKIITEWLCVQDGGVFVSGPQTDARKGDIADKMNRLNRETAEAMTAVLDSVKSGELDDAKRRRISKEVRDVLQSSSEILMAVEGKVPLDMCGRFSIGKV